MSMTDAALQPERSQAAESSAAPAAAEPLPRFPTAIVPQATISGRALVAVVAIMTFLASLTIGAVTLVRAAANQWQADVAREITIQVRPAAGRDIETDVAAAAAIAHAFPGVADVRPYSKEETVRLLEPWLGSVMQFEELPIPRMVVVRIAPGARPDLAQLRESLEEKIPGAGLDDHRGFVQRMRVVSRATLLIGLGVLALVLLATMLCVMFATRAAMATNGTVIEVLHLIGARDSYIAGHFQQHFLQLGLKGGVLGGAGAVALFAFADIASGWFVGTEAGDQFAALFGTFSIGALGYLAVLMQIGLIAAVTAITSRRTVTRTIASMH